MSNLKATKRENVTSGSNNKLRADGFIPAILYGGKDPNLKISIEKKNIQSVIKSENFLSKVAYSINLSKYIITQSGMDGEKFKKNDSILSDVMEAIIGAIYIDGNISFVKSFIEKFFNINNKKSNINSKSALQELVLQNGLILPNYELIKKEGPDHNPFFIIKVTAMGFFSEGKGKTIKLAELDAAKNILKIIREKKY